MSDGMEEIISDFITEAEESLDKIDPLFVELETRGHDRELLNSIFRSMHTIKGAAGFLGFQDIVDVAHKTENLLKKLREGEMAVTTDLITVVLQSVDMLKELLVVIKEQGTRPAAMDTLLRELDRALVMEAVAEEFEEEGLAAAGPTAQGRADMMFEQALSEAAFAETDALEETTAGEEETAPAGPETEEPYEFAGYGEPGGAPASQQYEGGYGGEVAEAVSDAIDSALLHEEEHEEEHHLNFAAKETQKAAPAPEQMREEAPQEQAGRGAAPKGVMQTLRVDVDRIDKVMNLTGEIVLVRNRLLNISGYLDQKYSGDEHVEGLQEAVSFLDLVTSDIQLAVMKMRMQPIKKVFGKFPRLVRDISQNLGKDVHLNISGEDTEVDRTVIERIGDPLVHIIRNAIDHGIEPVEQRHHKGKPPKGLVEITAYQQGSQIVIEVSDDGRGIDVERVKAKGIKSGLITEEDAARMTDKEAVNLVFLPGFSTMEMATEMSGRGVGMDVVKTNIAKLNGYVELLTTRDAGTTVRISIPLTLAIIQALMVRTGGVQYAIPLGPIEETLKIAQKDVRNVTSRRVLTIRNKVYPLAELTSLLGSAGPAETPEHRYVLVIAVGDRNFCVAVDELLGQEEVVIKAIEGIDTDATGILGATITGDGKIVLILDPSNMSKVMAGIAAAQG